MPTRPESVPSHHLLLQFQLDGQFHFRGDQELPPLVADSARFFVDCPSSYAEELCRRANAIVASTGGRAALLHGRPTTPKFTVSGRLLPGETPDAGFLRIASILLPALCAAFLELSSA